jgi:hypothetical protein
MAKLKPIDIPEEDKIDPVTKIVPDRVQKLIDLYKKNKVEYPWTETDYIDRTFEYRRTLHPKTYKYSINSIYRVRDARDFSKEYYFYQMMAHVDNDNGEPEYSNSLTYGYAVEREHKLEWNDKIKQKEPVRIRENPTYFFEWNKEEVKKLLDGSEIPCINFQIGTAGAKGQGDSPVSGPLYAVKSVEDFLEGSFEDLVLLNKSGVMSEYGSSLHLIDKARKRIEDRTLERIHNVEEGKEK